MRVVLLTAHNSSTALRDEAARARAIKLVRTCVLSACFLKTHRNTQVCFVSSARGVTVSYRLIKSHSSFQPAQHCHSGVVAGGQREEEEEGFVVWNNQHLLIFPSFSFFFFIFLILSLFWVNFSLMTISCCIDMWQPHCFQRLLLYLTWPYCI